MNPKEAKSAVLRFLSTLGFAVLACNQPTAARLFLTPDPDPPYPSKGDFYPSDPDDIMPQNFRVLIPEPKVDCSFVVRLHPLPVGLLVKHESLSLSTATNFPPTSPEIPAVLDSPMGGAATTVWLDPKNNTYSVHTEYSNPYLPPTPTLPQLFITPPAGN